MTLKTFQVEGGLTLYAVSPADAQAEAHANRDGQVYFGKGKINLREGDVVIDLGANVGSFARMAAPVVGSKGTIYCLEPLQEVYVALDKNADLFQQWADKQKMPVGKVIAVHAGCGDEASLPERDFTYYPRITAMSSMYPDEPDAAQATYSLVINRPQSFSLIEDIGKSIAKCMPSLYHRLHCWAFTHLLLRPVRQERCPMTTVSRLMEQYKISSVGLLKLNVERAEWDCLVGIQDKDWTKIRQVSAQVHDLEGRVAKTVQLLTSKGFKVSVFQEPRFQDCCLHMVYGYRLG